MRPALYQSNSNFLLLIPFRTVKIYEDSTETFVDGKASQLYISPDFLCV